MVKLAKDNFGCRCFAQIIKVNNGFEGKAKAKAVLGADQAPHAAFGPIGGNQPAGMDDLATGFNPHIIGLLGDVIQAGYLLKYRPGGDGLVKIEPVEIRPLHHADVKRGWLGDDGIAQAGTDMDILGVMFNQGGN